MEKLYKQHIDILQARTEAILDELQLKGLVIASGKNQYYFEDDQTVPYRPNHHFAHWCPLESDESVLIVAPGTKPKLLAFIPEDFWHERKPLDNLFWCGSWDISIFSTVDEIWDFVAKHAQGFGFHGPLQKRASEAGLRTSVEGLVPRLNWYRAMKSPYEVHCLEEATRLAALGHEAAKQAFLMGESELGIHHAYLVSCRMTDLQLPYKSIVCLNEKAAYLHYEDKRDDVRNGKTLLIDAGCAYQGYASDITRTYASDKAPPEFQKMVEDMNVMQKYLCKLPQLGSTMADLHWESHIGIAKILIENNILLNIDQERAVELALTADFYPHGIGHMLGLFVHDVAGRQINPAGDDSEPDPRFPKLRSLRRFEEGHYFTIEPGIYFIGMLLDKRRTGEHHQHYNWTLIDRLRTCGGIRVEDNILMTKFGPRNITREFLPN